MSAPSLFERDGDAVIATELSRGPWDPRACHGGPVSALLVSACEAAGDDAPAGGWQISRITVELVRPVPVGEPLILATEIERPGRNVSLVGVRATLASGVEVGRARCLRIRRQAVPLDAGYAVEPPFSAPGDGRASESVFGAATVAYHSHAVTLRFVDSEWVERGPAALWVRLEVPVLPDLAITGPQRAVAAADFSNGVSGELDPNVTTFINPDLSVHLARVPQGDWIGMQTRSHYGPEGAGVAEAALFDEIGRVGRSAQSLFLASR